jgi:PAT family beta-lactamase induction signal transducer AmpG
MVATSEPAAKSAEVAKVPWSQSVYLKPRVAVMLLLGFSSGLPLYLTGTGSLMQAWLTERDVSLENIGLFGLVALAYGWKFVWSPAIDGFAIPGLSRLLGHRRSWLLVIQIALMIGIILMGQLDPAAEPLLLAGAAVVVAFLAASQDIAVDAFRIESLPEDELAAGTANFSAAYRVALLVSFTGAVAFVSFCQTAWGMTEQEAWSAGYALMGALVGIGIIGTLLAKESWAEQKAQFEVRAERRFKTAVLEPFKEFVRKDLWWVILLFVVLFKLGDAFTTELRTAFFLTMGFERTAYAAIQWPFAFFSALVGGFLGGYLANKLGLMRSLWIAGLAQMFTNLTFIWPAIYLPGIADAIGVANDEGVKQLTFGALDAGGATGVLATSMMAGTIAVEQFATGLGGVIFIAYLSHLCGNRAYTATQYALLSSFAAQARVSLAAPSGFVAANLGWVWYYVIATALAIPGLALLLWLWRREQRLEQSKSGA